MSASLGVSMQMNLSLNNFKQSTGDLSFISLPIERILHLYVQHRPLPLLGVVSSGRQRATMIFSHEGSPSQVMEEMVS